MTSHDLLSKWMSNRDELAFRDLVERHASMVFSTSKRILGNEIEAQDVAQECFETLALTRRPPRGHLAAWLHRVATNRCLDRLRSTRRRSERETTFAKEQFSGTSTGWNDIYQLVDAAILDLPQRLRDPVVAHFLEGRSQSDIANELGLTRQAVNDRIQRGIEGIRKYFKRRGVQISGAALTALFVQHMSASAAVLPVSLTVSLGKLALSAQATGTATFAMGGILKAVLGVVIVAGIVGAALFIRQATRDSAPTASAIVDLKPIDSPSNAVAAVASPAPDLGGPVVPSAIPALKVARDKLVDPTKATASVSGIVMRADGTVFSNATIHLRRLGHYGHASGITGGKATVDASGGFLIEGLPDGEFSVQIMPPGITFSGGSYEVTRLVLEPNEQRSGVRFVYGKEGKLRISGTVTDTAGKPIVGVHVRTDGQYTTHRVAASDDQGHFVLEFLPPGHYQVSADFTVHSSPLMFGGNVVVAEAGDENVKITLERTLTLEGKVVNADTRAPIQNFQISFMNGHAQEYSEFLMGNAKLFSNESGGFRLDGVVAGDVTLSAIADGFSPAFIHLHGNDGANLSGLEVALHPGRTVRGHVVDADGQPVAGARIYFGAIGQTHMFETATNVAQGKTDSEGVFSIVHAPPSGSFLAVYHDNFAPSAARIGEGDMQLVMQRFATLKVFADQPEDTMTGARVIIFYGRDVHSDDSPSMKFDKDGVAVNSYLIPGPARVRIHRRSDTDTVYVERDVVLKPGVESEIHADFAPLTTSLEGIVTWRGVPAANTGIFLSVETGKNTEQFREITTTDGAYSFRELPAGTASMRLEVLPELDTANPSLNDPRLALAKRSVVDGIQLAAGSAAMHDVILLGAGSVTGRIAGLDSSHVAGISILKGSYTFEVLADYSLSPDALFRLVASGPSDADGNYVYDGLESGDYTVLIVLYPNGHWNAGQPFASAQVHVTADQTAIADFQYP